MVNIADILSKDPEFRDLFSRKEDYNRTATVTVYVDGIMQPLKEIILGIPSVSSLLVIHLETSNHT